MDKISSPYWHPVNAEGFILDWDGVLADTRLDFSGIRKKYFNGKRVPLIEAGSLLLPEERKQLHEDIYQLEMDGAKTARPVKGAFELVHWLEEKGIPWAVVSRNCMDSISLAAEKIGFSLPEHTMARDGGPQKPDPKALLLAADRIGVYPSRCAMVGDFVYDMVGARRAGMRGILVENLNEDWSFWADVCFPTVSTMVEDLVKPVPVVPWEYHSLVRRKGEKWLENAWKLNVSIVQNDTEAAVKTFRALSLGVGSVFVEPESTVTMEQWEKWPGASAHTLDTSLVQALALYVKEHFPLASICERPGGIAIYGNDCDLEEILEGFVY